MIRLLLIALALVLTGCSTPDNDVIDQAIAARIYRGTSSETVPYMNIPK